MRYRWPARLWSMLGGSGGRLRPLAAPLLLAVVLAIGLALLLVPSVAGHAYLQRADPPPDAVLDSAPPRIQLWFTETIEPNFSEIVVLDTARQPVHTSRAEASTDRLSLTLALPALPEGAYTVSWKTLSTVDGHPARGFHALTIGQAAVGAAPVALPPPPESRPVAQVFVRWLTFTGQTLLVGGLLAGPLVLTPLLAAGAAALAAAHRWRGRLLLAALVILTIAALDTLALQAATVLEVPLTEALGAPALTILTTTRYGLIWGFRALLLLALAGVAFWLERRPTLNGWPVWLGIGLGLQLLLTTSLTSHGAAVADWAVPAVLADWLHLIATSLWVGGLAQLVLVLPPAIAASQPEERTALLGRVIERFSRLSLLAVVILIATGLVGSLLHLDGPVALISTDYGRALAAKLLLLVPMLALAALNLLWVRPTLLQAARGGARLAARLAPALARARRLLGLATRLELGLGLLILVAAGWLTSLAPARQPVMTSGVFQSETADDLRLTLRIAPALPGDNTLEVGVTQNGRPVDDASAVVVRLTYLDEELGETESILPPVGGGRYATQTRQLSVLGQWQAEIIVRRDGRNDARTALRFAVPTGSAPTAAASWPTLTTAGQIGLGSLLLGAILLPLGLRLRRSPTLSGGLLGTSLGAIALAIYLLTTSGFETAAASADGRRNPYPPTAQSLARGRVLYSTNCQSCHGISGRGDGPRGVALRPPPADFTQHVGLHSDAELFRQISQGIPRSAMPPFAGILSEEERWHLVNYIKTFERSGP